MKKLLTLIGSIFAVSSSAFPLSQVVSCNKAKNDLSGLKASDFKGIVAGSDFSEFVKRIVDIMVKRGVKDKYGANFTTSTIPTYLELDIRNAAGKKYKDDWWRNPILEVGTKIVLSAADFMRVFKGSLTYIVPAR